MRAHMCKYASKIYLDFLVATNYPEQEPEHRLARWYDMLWFCVPMIGFWIFIEAVGERKRRKKNGGS